jgi:hypothetical protein
MLAPAQQGGEFSALGLAQFDTIAYIHLGLLVAGGPDEHLRSAAHEDLPVASRHAARPDRGNGERKFRSFADDRRA